MGRCLSLPHLACSALSAVLVTCALVPAPASAATFTPPPSCTAFLTVQMRGCLVSQHYTCSADAPGEQWTMLYDSDGPFFASKVDAEFQWLESRDMNPARTTLLEQPSADPASLGTLMSTGRDDYDFTTRADDGEQRRYRGHDTLTGETVNVDGVALEVTAFEMTETDGTGTLISRRSGQQFVNRDWRLFFSGAETYEAPEGALPIDNRPMKFIHPGQPGYLSTVPLFDCDALFSQADEPLMEDLRHDQL